MGWKNWPYWIRGGLIGIISYVLISLIGIFYFNITKDLIINYPKIIGNILFPAQTIFFYLPFAPDDGKMPIFNLILYFIFGAIIGWIVGKRRTNNS